MARTYVTDIQHLLDESGRPTPGPAGEMARYLGRISEAGSVIPVGKGRSIAVRCRNPSHRKRCGAQLAASVPDQDTIEWQCSGCGERGLITNWAQSAFDLSDVPWIERETEGVDLLGPLAEFDAVLRRCDLPRALRRLLVDAAGLGEQELFVFADYQELTALRDAASKAAGDATGEDRRLLDRFTGRADGLAATLWEFLEGDAGTSKLLN